MATSSATAVLRIRSFVDAVELSEFAKVVALDTNLLIKFQCAAVLFCKQLLFANFMFQGHWSVVEHKGYSFLPDYVFYILRVRKGWMIWKW